MFNMTNQNKKEIKVFLIILLAFVAIGALVIQSGDGGVDNPSSHKFHVDGVVIDFQMTPDEVRSANKDATIIQHVVPSVMNELVELEGYDYFVINNDIAVTFEDNKIDRFITWNTDYKTQEGLQVGCTWGEVERVLPNMEFYITCYNYNYFSQQYEMAVVLENPATCTAFIFYHNAFSSIQWESLTSIAGGTDGCSYFYTSELSYSMLQSIWSSVTVSQILVYDCQNEKSDEKINEKSNGDYLQYDCLKYRLIHDYYSDGEMLELYNTSGETILVTGSLLNAIASHGGTNTLEFEETIPPYQTKYVDGFLENECTIFSVQKLTNQSGTSSSSKHQESGDDGYVYKFSCDRSLFNSGEIYELTLPNGDVIRYSYNHDNRWCDFHSSERGIHYDGNLHYIQFALASSGWTTISSYRVKARRYDDSQWWPAVDPENMGRTCDIVCEWYDFRTDVPLIVSFKKKKR